MKTLIWYVISGFGFLLEWKLLTLSLGIDASILELVLMINVWGLMNFMPTPGSLGFFEAGQSGLFYIMMNDASLGLALSLLVRIAFLLVTLVGFVIILQFGINELLFKSKNEKK